MKPTNYIFSALLLSTVLQAYGQNAATTQTPVASAKPQWTIAAMDGNTETLVRPPDPGDIQEHRVVKMATGMNYWDGQKWSPSEAAFVATNGGFAASQVQNKVFLSSQLNVDDAVTVVTSDGTTLNSSPVAIALYDAASGDTLIIGVITNCVGGMVSSNQVCYVNAFNGVSADVFYTVSKGAFAQDVVFDKQINPADYGFPAATTRIQILTEFYNAPQPESVLHPIYVEKNEAIRSQMASPDFTDETLGFGNFVLGQGRAYTSANTNSLGGAPVGKQFTTIAGRTFLIESVLYPSIEREMESLPASGTPIAQTTLLRHSGKLGLGYAGLPKLAPAGQVKVKPSGMAKQLAMVDLKKHGGVVIDYVGLDGSLNDPVTFQGDTTYYVSGAVYCNGDVTIEGNAVFKYDNLWATGCNPCFIQVNSTVECKTGPYRPAVFTAVDDDTVGDSMDGVSPYYTGTIDLADDGGYADPAIWDTCYNTFENCRFSYATLALTANYDENFSTTYTTVNDSQFVDCIMGIQMTGIGYGGSGISLLMNNCLLANVQYPFYFSAPADYPYVYGYNCTIANSDQLIGEDEGTPGAYFYNSIFANVDNLGVGADWLYGNNNGFYSSSPFGSSQYNDSSWPFQTAGGGSYYLETNSPFHNVGTHDLGSGLLADLAQKTTYPPIVYSNATFSVPTTLGPQAQRDTNSSPDLGYHYDPIDYAFGGCEAASNVTFTAGTAVGWFRTTSGWEHAGYGIYIANQQVVTFQGTATAPCYWARLNTVQEQDLSAGYGPGGLDGEDDQYDDDISLSPIVQADFLRCSEMSGDPGQFFRDDYGYLIVQANNSEFYSRGFGGYGMSISLTNCLFERSGTGNGQGWVGDFFNMDNCTFHGGSLGLTPNETAFPINVVNCSFEGTAIDCENYGANGSYATYDYNAYTNSSDPFPIGGAHDVIVTNGFDWQTSWFGSYYLPTNSPVIDKGSTTADQVGLYHFTTQTNQVPETNSIVDIGYHYVATDAYGNPLDSNGDGVPDYIEDANGNGLDDSGEIGWNIVGDLGLKVIITRPRNGSTLP
ncbi:MAG TPA: hypothetical protein VMD27_07410 [Candidatus Aquilonibacter sp.]|nr:hypothetical protein [Candidatus Aquilonibacter sp.]